MTNQHSMLTMKEKWSGFTRVRLQHLSGRRFFPHSLRFLDFRMGPFNKWGRKRVCFESHHFFSKQQSDFSIHNFTERHKSSSGWAKIGMGILTLMIYSSKLIRQSTSLKTKPKGLHRVYLFLTMCQVIKSKPLMHSLPTTCPNSQRRAGHTRMDLICVQLLF